MRYHELNAISVTLVVYKEAYDTSRGGRTNFTSKFHVQFLRLSGRRRKK